MKLRCVLSFRRLPLPSSAGCGILLAILLLTVPAFCGPIHDAARDGNLVRVKALLKSNPALLQSRDGGGETPLHWAAFWGRIDVASFLLASGADLHARDNAGHTPLDYAIAHGRDEMVVLLRLHDHGAQMASISGVAVIAADDSAPAAPAVPPVPVEPVPVPAAVPAKEPEAVPAPAPAPAPAPEPPASPVKPEPAPVPVPAAVPVPAPIAPAAPPAAHELLVSPAPPAPPTPPSPPAPPALRAVPVAPPPAREEAQVPAPTPAPAPPAKPVPVPAQPPVPAAITPAPEPAVREAPPAVREAPVRVAPARVAPPVQEVQSFPLTVEVGSATAWTRVRVDFPQAAPQALLVRLGAPLYEAQMAGLIGQRGGIEPMLWNNDVEIVIGSSITTPPEALASGGNSGTLNSLLESGNATVKTSLNGIGWPAFVAQAEGLVAGANGKPASLLTGGAILTENMLADLTFDSDPNFPLTFRLVRGQGLVYLCGRGTVTANGVAHSFGQRPEDFDWAVRLLEGKTVLEREGAAQTIGWLHYKDLLQPLIDAMTNPRENLLVRRSAIEAAGRIHDPAATPALEALSFHSDPRLAAIARWSLKQIELAR